MSVMATESEVDIRIEAARAILTEADAMSVQSSARALFDRLWVVLGRET